MKPKKSYGQHFLINDSIAQRIVEGLKNETGYDNILEVGPGKGVLTRFLLSRQEKLLLVEADADMVEHLKEKFPSLADRVIHFDFLRFDPSYYFGDQPFGLIGNFPYNVSSQILIRMIKFRDSIPEMVGMFQKEVAHRIVASPGNKTYGVISLLVQAFYEGEILFNVEPGSFFPAPKVRSSVIRLTKKCKTDLGCDYELFRSVVKTAFGQRRKMLRNTMKSFIKGSEVLSRKFFNLRPEDLSLEDFIELTNLISFEQNKNDADRKNKP